MNLDLTLYTVYKNHSKWIVDLHQSHIPSQWGGFGTLQSAGTKQELSE